MSSRPEPSSADTIEQLVRHLDSLLDGDRAAAMLLAKGPAVVPSLSHYLLEGPPRTIALPRCRAVHTLGELGAYSVLISYFQDRQPPADPVVLFAEDAVRSAAAQELSRWPTEESFVTLLEATRTRATGGLVRALGRFQRAEAVPVLFNLLEDDLCREEAMEALRKIPDAARNYGTLLLRGQTELSVQSESSLRRLRATLHLLLEFALSGADWEDVQRWLQIEDAEVVIAVVSIGLKIGPEVQRKSMFEALLRIARSANWAQEDTIESLLDTDRDLASEIARVIAHQHKTKHESPNWLNPSWRILRHVLGDAL